MHHHWETAVIKSMESVAKERIAHKISSNLKALTSRQPWDVNVEPILLDAKSKWLGMEVRETNLRAQTGALIAGIERGGFELANIDPTTKLYPHDKVFLLGEDDQIQAAREYLNKNGTFHAPQAEAFAFTREIIPPRCNWSGLRIQDSQLRSRFNVTIVGIQKGDQRIIGPSPQEILDEGDLILVMGSKEKIKNFKIILNSQESEAEVTQESQEPQPED
jgi:CPA2 family monovalent cation:H+ antiporter-2